MKHLFSILTAVFAVFTFMVSCGGSGGSDDSGGIYGYVTDAVTGEPVPNAYIVLDNYNSVRRSLTGSDGYFEFINLSKSRYGIKVDKQGYKTFRSNPNGDYSGYNNIVVEDEMIRFDVLLEPEK